MLQPMPETDQPIGTVVSDAAQPIGGINQPIGNPGHSGTLGEAIAGDSDVEELEDTCV